jgi:hypothetical protein
MRRSASHLRTPSGVSSSHHSRSDLGMIVIYTNPFHKPCPEDWTQPSRVSRLAKASRLSEVEIVDVAQFVGSHPLGIAVSANDWGV